MAEKTIMLCCAADMSISMLIARMQDTAKTGGEGVEIFTCPAAEADDKLAQEDVSAILLGPQVRCMLDSLKQKVNDKNIPVDVIDIQAYGMMGEEKILKQGLSLIK